MLKTITHRGLLLSTHFERGDEKYVLAHVLPAVTHEGEPVTFEQFIIACHNARLEGLRAFPRDGCTNFDKRSGKCLGCEVDDRAGQMEMTEARRRAEFDEYGAYR